MTIKDNKIRKMTTQKLLIKDHDILIHRKPNLRAKRLSLRLAPQRNIFVLTVPPLATERSIKNFLTRCTPWIEKNVEKISQTKQIAPGEEIILHGTSFYCVTDPLRRKPVLCTITHTLRLPSQYSQEELYDLFKKMASEQLTPYVIRAGQILGQEIKKITFRDTKTRWGSCSAKKTISLNWRLLLAPPDVAQYVCAHEAAHLLHMNHSGAFWKVVEALCPAYKTHRKWLKSQGQSLMGV